MQPGQHRRRSSTEHPHGEENDEQRGGEHHLPCVRRRVPNRQGKRHRSSQSCNTHTHTHAEVYTPTPNLYSLKPNLHDLHHFIPRMHC